MISKRKPAIFLDRDGVLNAERSYVCGIEDFYLFPYAKACVQTIQKKGYYAIVISNQSGIARGLFSEDALRRMNVYLIAQTGVDAVYYCPHLQNGVVKKYCFQCNCRKPRTGMIERACQDFLVDLQHSFFVGDRMSDILTGKNAGIKTVLLRSGYRKNEPEAFRMADYVFDDLQQILAIL